MKRFYISAIRPTLEYGAQVWHGGLTKAQSSSIGKVQRRALRIIYSEKDYEKLLLKAEMHTLEQRRNTMCIDHISKMSDPQHKLHHLLPNKLCKVRQRDTRQNGQLFYNYHYRTGVCKSRNPTRNTRNQPGTPPGTPGTLPGTPGTPPGTPGTPPGTPRTPPGTCWNTSYAATHVFLYKFMCFALNSG